MIRSFHLALTLAGLLAAGETLAQDAPSPSGAPAEATVSEGGGGKLIRVAGPIQPRLLLPRTTSQTGVGGAARTDDRQIIIVADPVRETPTAPELPLVTRTSPRWRWVAIGAGVAGTVAALLLTRGTAGAVEIAVPGSGETPTPTPITGVAINPAPAPTTTATPPGNRRGGGRPDDDDD